MKLENCAMKTLPIESIGTEFKHLAHLNVMGNLFYAEQVQLSKLYGFTKQQLALAICADMSRCTKVVEDLFNSNITSYRFVDKECCCVECIIPLMKNHSGKPQSYSVTCQMVLHHTWVQVGFHTTQLSAESMAKHMYDLRFVELGNQYYSNKFQSYSKNMFFERTK